MYLQTGGIVDFCPDSAKAFAISSFKDLDVESMTDAVGGRGHSGQAGTDDCDFGTTETRAWRWRCRREDVVEEVLEELVEEDEGAIEELADVGVKGLALCHIRVSTRVRVTRRAIVAFNSVFEDVRSCRRSDAAEVEINLTFLSHACSDVSHPFADM